MAKESERTYVMKQNFVQWFQEGLNIREIAEKCDLSRPTVYRHLQEIADMYGVDREAFLQIIRTPTPRQYDDEAKRVKVQSEKLLEGFDTLHNSILGMRSIIADILKEEEK